MSETRYHYKNQEPFEYIKDNKNVLSTLATNIKELYPLNWEIEHGDNAEKDFKELHVGDRCKHLWSPITVGSKKRNSTSPSVTIR